MLLYQMGHFTVVSEKKKKGGSQFWDLYSRNARRRPHRRASLVDVVKGGEHEDVGDQHQP